ncbi:MAG: hypothetical protein U9Q95_05125 [Candidatus Eisenbacteria bacterium]|nr:hypothetical protein [Candidatus Eisenbacteria bacterium]
MRQSVQVLTAALVLLAFIATPALAGLVDVAVGAYGGMNVSLEDDASAGSVIGAKVRVVPPIPMFGFEAWYARFGYEDPGTIVAQGGELSLALDGDGFNMWGVDVLIGSVHGMLGIKWYGIVGINSAKFEEFGADGTESRFGGELGAGAEVSLPFVDLGVEGRGTVLFPDLSGDFSEKLLAVTVGLNYHF